MPSPEPALAPHQIPVPQSLASTGQFLARCRVSAGGVDTEYVRLGRGAPVLLLAAAEGEEPPALLAPLAARFRVIAPTTADSHAVSDERFSTWLRDFLDGLGVSAAGVVAEAGLGAAAFRFAAAEPARVLALALLGAAAPELAAAVPVLALPDGAADLGAVLAFLASHA